VIVCVAANPSIDKLFEVERLTLGAIHRPLGFVQVAGGEAKAAHSLGAEARSRPSCGATPGSGSRRPSKGRGSGAPSSGRTVRTDPHCPCRPQRGHADRVLQARSGRAVPSG